MKRTSAFVVIAAFCSASWIMATPKHVLTGKGIYDANREAIVQIGIGNNFSGDGFIISANGLIVTANHVVATRESGLRKYADNLMVRVVRNGIPKIYPATPVESEISDNQVNFDSAILKINASGLPHVTLGDWNEVDVGDQIAIIPSFPGPEVLMLQGIVSSKAAANDGLGPKLVNTIWFQCPIHNGFSGAPIFSSAGHVIGIVDTKVFGITPALDSLRSQWEAGSRSGTIMMTGVNVSQSFLEMINNLDQNLVSGLGSGVSVEYAKQQEQAQGKPTTQN